MMSCGDVAKVAACRQFVGITASFARNVSAGLVMLMLRLVVVPMVLHPSSLHTTHMHTHDMRALFQLKTLAVINSIEDVIMPQPRNKAGWIDLLREAGEEVPASWTILQMKTKWEELQSAKVEITENNLEEKIKGLKRASRKKADLTDFLKTEEIPMSSNATIAQMFARAEEAITQRFEPKGNELMGFGKHGNMTFQETLDQAPGYATWCKTTVMETDDCSWHMKRFVKWLHMQEHGEKFRTKAKAKPKSAPSVADSFSIVSDGQSGLETDMGKDQQIALLMGQIQQLQEENNELSLKDARTKTRKET